MRRKQGRVFIAFVGIFVCFSALVLAGPTKTISGIVATDAGIGIEGVDVVGDNGATSTVTAADGSYAITTPNNWSGTIAASKAGWLITPSSKTYTNQKTDLTGENFLAYQPKISGLVTKSDGTPLAGAVVTADNGGSDTTDASGYYEFYVPYDWSGTVSVTLAEYHFTDKNYTNVITDQANQDFSGYQPTISGSTGVAGATVTVSGVGSVVSTPDYSITVPYDWSGTVEAALTGYHFPESPRSYTNVTANQTAQNYTPYQPTISGTVTKDDGTPLSGVFIMCNYGSTDTTDSSGYYEIIVPYDWHGTVWATLAGYHFTDRTYTNVVTDQTGQDFTGYQPSISGIIKAEDGSALEGVSVSADNGGNEDITDPNGYYRIIVPYDWSGAVSVSKPGWGFTEFSRAYQNVTEDLTGQDFTGFQPLVSGTVYDGFGAGVVDAEVAADGLDSVLTDESGHYEIVVPYDWSGTVTPSKTDWGFTPTSRVYNNVIADQTSQDYTIFQPIISGTIRDKDGVAVESIEVSAEGIGTTYTDPNGYYEFVVPYGWTGTVTPSKTDWGFSPLSKMFSNVLVDMVNQDFTVFQPTISGSAINENGYPISGATVTTDNGGGSDTTATNGYYEITVPYNWSGVIEIEKPDWFFDPNTMSYTNVTSNQTGQNYTGIYVGIGITGSGTQEDPYLISNLPHFDEFAGNPSYWASGVYTKLMCNLDLTGRIYSRAVIAPDTDIYRAWYTGTPFSGHFDGNGYAIQNLTITQQTYYVDHVGLFGEINEGVVENLGVENVKISLDDDSYAAGGIVAANDGIIRNCYATGRVEDGLSCLGGIAGYNSQTALIIDSYSTCEIFGRYDCDDIGGLVGVNYGRLERCETYDGGAWALEDSALAVGGLAGRNNGDIVYCNSGSIAYVWGNSYAVGGLVGRNNSGNIMYCYSYGRVHGWSTAEYIGGLVGWNNYGIIENCYTTASVRSSFTPPVSLGEFTGRNSIYSTIRNCFSAGTIENAIGVNEGTIINLECHPLESMQQQATFTDGPAKWDFVGEYTNGGSDDWSMPDGDGHPVHWWQLESWPGLPTFAGGSGTAENPYLISDCNDLNSIGHNPRLMDKSFRLINNVDCKDTSFFAIGEEVLPFAGIFDGQFNKIQNIYYQADMNKNIGLFPYLDSDSLIKNLGIENITIEAPSAENVGAMAGISYGQIQSCYAESAITVDADSAYVGGFVGLNYGSVKRSFSSAQISAGDDCYALGGFVGRDQGGSFHQCYSEGFVSGGNNCRAVGGFIGQTIGQIDFVECASWASISTGESSYSVGGFIGQKAEYEFEPFISCYWDAEISGIADPEEGSPDTDGLIGLPTAQMQTLSTFIDAGWDFVDESANGENEIWRMCVDGVDYPRLSWEFSQSGDFACPDGVSIVDLESLALNWLTATSIDEATFNYACDANGDGQINLKDYAILADNWLWGSN